MNIITKTKEKLIFTLEISESLANALRRAVSEIPILAIDEVEFYKNDSILNDQMLAHRIGLIPLKNEKLELREECICNGEGCAKCAVQLKAGAKGPKNLYAKDLKGKAEAVFEDMPLAILEGDQEIEFVAHARLGRGKEHAKFTPGLVYYRHAYNFSAKNESFKKVTDKYKNQISFMEKTGSGYLADLPEACIQELESEGVPVEPAPQLVFLVESFGQIDAKDIFLQSIEVLRNHLKLVSKNI